ncbi:MAG: site-2 protease family protein [Spirochaetales bacterium]|nr:site-2 protease family protein [Spirochaetales bacterium]
MGLPINLNLAEMILIYIFLVLSFGMHEAAHAKVAELFGDPQPAKDGVSTWNPIPHLRRSFFSSVIIPAVTWFLLRFFIGGAFTRLDPARIKSRRWGYAAAVAAGPLMNLALAVLCGILAVLYALAVRKHWTSVGVVMLVTGSFNFFGFVFNLLPIPPLDGSSVIRAVFPATDSFFRALQGIPVLLILLVGSQIGPIAAAIFLPLKLYRDALVGILQALPL